MGQTVRMPHITGPIPLNAPYPSATAKSPSCSRHYQHSTSSLIVTSLSLVREIGSFRFHTAFPSDHEYLVAGSVIKVDSLGIEFGKFQPFRDLRE